MVKIKNSGAPMYYGASKLIRERAKELRKNTTPEEQLLWVHLSDKKLGARFRRQHPIHTYIVDFFCPELKLAIEVDGGIHQKKEQRDYDLERDEILSEFGILTLRFTNLQVVDEIENLLKSISSKIAELREVPFQG